MEPAIEVVVESHVATNVPIIIEGDGILPSLVDRPAVRSPVDAGDASIVFLTEDDEEAILANFIARNRGIEGRPMEEVRTEAHVKLLFSRWIEAQASERWCPMLPSRPLNSLADRMLSLVGQGDPPPAAGR